MNALVAETPAEAFQRRATDRALRTGCFEPSDYASLHPDLAAVNPTEHFATFGLWEGRRAVAWERFFGTLAKAMAKMHADGGQTIAESEETAVVWGMPGELVMAKGADWVLPLPGIAERLQKLTP